ncbi:DivIVA domain-containing protein [Nocardiopsis sp. NRRL B-16309]|uniref:DivIVA domain-containing protein n=1 Tax=Nocardiopsis sp. NRRL B-16309 TaxID=1519494 RepID=UPI0006B01C86|nr:DivIVA domain-containing protein [Nocardiopsis sp. NRRL B-16309]KOX17101.1 hypothetical protein ADL05_11200 [Nocardiopsis sp. NRRL B-16309]
MNSPVPVRAPAFDVVLRGVDRRQVDDLVDRANVTLATLTGVPAFTDAALPVPGFPERRQPAPISAADLRAASLDVALRGYDRNQVGDVLNDLADRITEAESRGGRG